MPATRALQVVRMLHSTCGSNSFGDQQEEADGKGDPGSRCEERSTHMKKTFEHGVAKDRLQVKTIVPMPTDARLKTHRAVSESTDEGEAER
jgi:hypothetical protein